MYPVLAAPILWALMLLRCADPAQRHYVCRWSPPSFRPGISLRRWIGPIWLVLLVVGPCPLPLRLVHMCLQLCRWSASLVPWTAPRICLLLTTLNVGPPFPSSTVLPPKFWTLLVWARCCPPQAQWSNCELCRAVLVPARPPPIVSCPLPRPLGDLQHKE